MVVNYQNGKIYKIMSYDTDMVYIGATTQSLSKRLGVHVNSYKCYLNGDKRYMSSFIILETDNYYIELVQEYPCNNKQQLDRKEGEIIRKYKQDNICCNIFISGRNKKEWYQDNRGEISEKRKQSRQNNLDEIRKKENQWYHDNRGKIKERKKEKKHCTICNCYIGKGDFKRHTRSKKHIFNNDRNSVIFKQEEENKEGKKHCTICDVYIGKGDFKRHERSKKHISNLEKQNNQ